MRQTRERLAWVDTFRFLGMLTIYVGHFGAVAGKLYPFVFLYHVPLFFFAAGFFAGRPGETAAALLVRLVRRLLLPYVFFALLYAVLVALLYDWPWLKLQDALEQFALGIRNQLPAGSLWFLPCLFVAALAHGIVIRFTRSPWAGLAFGTVCLLISQHALPFNPLAQPSWPLNVDSALYYVFWYALGHATFPALRGAVERPWFGVAGAIAAAACGWLYFNGTADVYSVLDLIPPGRRHNLAHTALGAFIVATAILANLAAARAIAGVELLGRLGTRTLVLCGTEGFVKLLLSQLLLLVGLTQQATNPLGAVTWSFACMLASGLVLAPLLERHAPRWSGLRTKDHHRSSLNSSSP